MRTGTRLGSLSILAAVLMAVLCGGTAWGATTFFVNSATGSDANDCLSATAGGPGVGPCLTITGAIAKALAGDTINVAIGTYAELVNVNKGQLTILGAKAGVDGRDPARTGLPASESVVKGNAGGSTSFFVTANDVTIDGFTVQDQTNVNQFGAGIVLGAGTSGATVVDNIVQNNVVGLFLANHPAGDSAVIQYNLFRANNNPGSASGQGIYTDQFVAGVAGLANVLIDNNTFTGHDDAAIDFSSTVAGSQSGVTMSSNLFDGNGRAFVLFYLTSSTITGNTITNSTLTASADIRVFDGISGLSITCNSVNNGVGTGMRISPFFGDPSSGITLDRNNIFGHTVAGLEVVTGAYTGTLNAENNWWGSATGPTSASNPGGTGDAIIDPSGVVDFIPFRTAAVAGCPAIQPSLTEFRDKRRGSEINVGNDLHEGPPATHVTAINFTGTATVAGDTWVTVYDPTPLVPTPPTNFTGSVSLSADVLIAKQNNAKGPGLLALYTQATSGTKGLALFLSEAGNTDRLVLATVTGAPSPPGAASAPTTLLAKALAPGQILINKWYRVTMDVVVTGGALSVTGKVFNHLDSLDPNSAVTTQVGGSLLFSGTLAGAGLAGSGEVGIAATAVSAIVNSSVTNFVINP